MKLEKSKKTENESANHMQSVLFSGDFIIEYANTDFCFTPLTPGSD